MTEWLILGAGGMLGRDVVIAVRAAQAGPRAQDARHRARDQTVIGLTHRDLDITDETAVRAAIHEYRPETVVNCAAWTAVDEAEHDEDRALGGKRRCAREHCGGLRGGGFPAGACVNRLRVRRR